MATIAGASLLVFVAVEASIPGGFEATLRPTGLNPDVPNDRRLIDEFHLDEHVLVRWLHWLADAATGDLGTSTRAGTAVTELLGPRLPISIELMLIGAVGMVLVGIPAGLLAAAWSHRRGGGDVVNAALGLAQSVPVFVTPLFLIWLFALELRWLPAAGWVRLTDSVTGNLKGLVLPGAALILAEVGIVGRIVRADVLHVLQSDYIVAATGKGLSRRYILLRHALRPASLGLLNVIGLNIGSLLSGAVIVEILFGIGALGQLLFEATINRDLYLILGLTTYVVVVYVTLNAIVDAVMRVLDPRITRPAM